jgi:signal transduction histidine kinase
MRRLVGVLREEDPDARLAPPPSLRQIETLISRVRDAGLTVDLSIEGEPVDLPPGIDGSAYRIVQEALTNALTHAEATSATVRVRYEVDRLALEITDTGTGPMPKEARPGHGLVGMRERVALYGGRLETGVAPGGGYRILASLPIEPISP